MDNLGILDISFEKDTCGVVKATHQFQLLPTEGTSRDTEVDEVIKKWRDRTKEGQEDGDVLCAVGTPLIQLYFTLNRKIMPVISLSSIPVPVIYHFLTLLVCLLTSIKNL